MPGNLQAPVGHLKVKRQMRPRAHNNVEGEWTNKIARMKSKSDNWFAPRHLEICRLPLGRCFRQRDRVFRQPAHQERTCEPERKKPHFHRFLPTSRVSL